MFNSKDELFLTIEGLHFVYSIKSKGINVDGYEKR